MAEQRTPSGAPPGALIGGHYRVQAVLGRGGMGAVYRVLDERDGRLLALKQLHGAGRDSVAATLMMSQFEREYHTLCQLAHPSIIAVYDYGIDDSGAFYTMELLDGQDLRERGQLRWQDACAVLRDVASTLAIMHSRRLLHRDISARNVRCTQAGSAKLIDFGAMTAMGVCRHVVGTPPFVPPEALQLQALDGRADLYALGVLAFWVLTSRYPYPARSFADLREQWRSVPASPRRYLADVPEALDQLVMELIELDRSARPKSAAEIMERLSGIAGLPLRELPEVSRAYLVAPTLIGRDEQLTAVRNKLIAARKREGGSSFAIEGAEGSGRSRLLEACTLEAKLLGATVLRADAADAAEGNYGVAKALCSRLVEERPALARRCARPWRAALQQLLPALASGKAHDDRLRMLWQPSASQPPAQPPASPSLAQERPSLPEAIDANDPRALPRVMREFLLAAAREQQLLIVVDDAERIDAPSAALLGALAHAAPRRKLTLIVALRTGAPPNPALSLLRELAQPLPLSPLTREQSEALLGSMFGEAGRLATLNERLYALSGGNPGWTMALCEHLVEHGLARYEAGSWRLPAELGSHDLPSSLTDAATARIAALPHDARALAHALSLADPSQLPLDRYPLLTDHGDASRVYRALDALVTSGILLPQADRYRFVQHGTMEVLRAELTPELRRELHARLAAAFEHAQDQTRAPHHMLLAGQDEAGLDRLMQQGTAPPLGLPELLDTYSAAYEAAVRVGRKHQQLEIQVRLVPMAMARSDYEIFQRHAWPLFEQLWRDSGFADFVELGHTAEPVAALQQVQARCQARFERTPEPERGYPPREAAVRVGTLMWTIVLMAQSVQELDLVERLPGLEPFGFIPTMQVIQLQVDYYRHLLAGRSHHAERTSRELLELVEGPSPVGLPAELSTNIRLFQLHNQGLFAAARGDPAALQWVAPIESLGYYRTYALRVQTAYRLINGDIEAAGALRRRAELFALEDGVASILPGTSTRLELIVYSAIDDVIGVKRTLERLEVIAARFANWRPSCELARSQYQRILGDLPRALDTVTAAMALMKPGRHIDWGLGAAMHVALLSASGRGEQAATLGQQYIALCEQEDLPPHRFMLLRVVSEALTRAGRPADALPLLQEHLAIAEQQGIRGLPLGLAYEARARIAIAAGDEASVQHYAQLCAGEYRSARSTALGARSKTLLRDAEAAGLVLSSVVLSELSAGAGAMSTGVSRTHGFTATQFTGLLLEHADRGGRAREGLRLLLESAGAAGGHLLTVEDGELQLLAASDGAAPTPELLRALQTSLRATSRDDDGMTRVDAAPEEAGGISALTDGTGQVYEPLLIAGSSDRAPILALLRYDSTPRCAVRRELLDALSDILAPKRDPVEA